MSISGTGTLVASGVDNPTAGMVVHCRQKSSTELQCVLESVVDNEVTNVDLKEALDEAGQIKVEYTGLSITNVVAATTYTFDIDAATTATIVTAPTKYPNSAPSESYASLFDDTRSTDNPTGIVGKLIENPLDKTANRWRIILSYGGKSINVAMGVNIGIVNPTSGFASRALVTMPEGSASGEFAVVIETIADSASIPSPNGYVLQFIPTHSDNDFSLEVESITRITGAAHIT